MGYTSGNTDRPGGTMTERELRAHAQDDPRPDLTGDCVRWQRLLLLAAPIDGADPAGLTGLLRYLRAAGASLGRGHDSYLLAPPPTMERPTMRGLVTVGGHGPLLTDLLRLAADDGGVR